MTGIRAALLLATALVVAPVAAAETAIRIVSEPDEYLFQGATATATSDNDTFNAVWDFDGSLQIQAFVANWSFRIEPPDGEELVADNYEQAGDWPFQSLVRPGLEVKGAGRECANETGRFVVREYVDDGFGVIQRLAVDIEHHCNFADETLRVMIRIESDIPLEVPEPTAAAGRDRLMLERDSLTLDAGLTMPGGGALVSYLWTQVAGPPATLSDLASETPVLTAPDVAGDEETLIFELRADNSLGLADTDRISIRVRNRSAPRTFFRMSSSFDDYVGQGKDWMITEDNGYIDILRSDDGNEVNLNLDADDWVYAFAAPVPEALQVAEYADIGQVPFHDDRPGLNVASGFRVCAGVSGEFRILVLDIATDPVRPDRFAADFTQVCANTGALTGEVRYRVIVPEADAGADQTVSERTPVALDATGSVDAEGTIVDYAWSQTRGTAVSLQLDDPARPVFEHELGDAILEEELEFELTVTDESGFRETDQVQVRVQQVNAPPVAVNDQVSIGQGFVAEIDPLANDYDSDGSVDAQTLEFLSEPADGTLSLNAGTGAAKLRVSSDFVGTEVIAYRIRDNDGAFSGAGSITFEFTPGPVGASDLASTDQDVAVDIDVLANDAPADAPLDPASVELLAEPRSGMVSFGASGIARYVPDTEFSGSDSFEYRVSDTLGRTSPVTYVTVNVKSTAPPAPPPPPADSGGGATDPEPVADSASPADTTSTAASEPRVGPFGGIDSGGGAPHPLSLLAVLLLLRRRAHAQFGCRRM